MIVGVGASRGRHLFSQAKAASPSIIFNLTHGPVRVSPMDCASDRGDLPRR
jgi:hypothetical protein